MKEMTDADWLDHYEKLRQKAFDNYQTSGEPRYDNALAKYEKICDGFRALIEQKDERDKSINKRIANCNYVIDRLKAHEPNFSFNEVVKLLRDAIYW